MTERTGLQDVSCGKGWDNIDLGGSRTEETFAITLTLWKLAWILLSKDELENGFELKEERET